MTKRFIYSISGTAEVEAETQQEADNKVWDMTPLEMSVDVNLEEIEE